MELEIERLGFRYENLASEHTIRILLLHPAPNHSDTLEFDLDHYERPDLLRESPSTPLHYDAISYFWGEPDFKHRMRCREQGTYLKITSRVDNMLRYLRKATAPRFLWIDAICLNQANREEKGIQIQKMGEIYTQARKVRVWLGAADGDTPKTFAFLHFIAALKRSGGPTPNAIRGGLVKIFRSDSLQTIESLLSKPWFGRRWVIQEVVLGHSIMVHCGPHKISWDWFTDGLSALLKVAEDIKLSHEAQDSLRVLRSMRRGAGSMLDSLWEFDRCACTDPRDRVNAMYGFVTAPISDATERRADYFRDYFEIYTDFAKLVVKSSGFLQLASHLTSFGNLSDIREDLPSWVPNWSGERKHLYAMKGFHKPSFSVDVVYRQGHYATLKMRVTVVGEVAGIREDWPEETSRSRLRKYVLELLDGRTWRNTPFPEMALYSQFLLSIDQSGETLRPFPEADIDPAKTTDLMLLAWSSYFRGAHYSSFWKTKPRSYLRLDSSETAEEWRFGDRESEADTSDDSLKAAEEWRFGDRESESDTSDDSLKTAEEWIEEREEISDWAEVRHMGNAFDRNFEIAKKTFVRYFLPLIGKVMQDKKVFQLRGYLKPTEEDKYMAYRGDEEVVYGSRVLWTGSAAVRRGDIIAEPRISDDVFRYSDDDEDATHVAFILRPTSSEDLSQILDPCCGEQEEQESDSSEWKNQRSWKHQLLNQHLRPMLDMGIERRFVGYCWTKSDCSFWGTDTYIRVV